MNRYDLSLWDMRKRQLYGRERESVQAATLAVVGYSNFVIPSAFFLARGICFFQRRTTNARRRSSPPPLLLVAL
jgi:hypothetical protein